MSTYGTRAIPRRKYPLQKSTCFPFVSRLWLLSLFGGAAKERRGEKRRACFRAHQYDAEWSLYALPGSAEPCTSLRVRSQNSDFPHLNPSLVKIQTLQGQWWVPPIFKNTPMSNESHLNF